jgi:protocatechuate 3,4-dioxygenase beta subunit
MERDPRIERCMAATAAAAGVLLVYLALAIGRGGAGQIPGRPTAPGDPAGSSDPGAEPELRERAGKGPHDLTGTVTDASGKPVSSVLVTAEPEAEAPPRRPRAAPAAGNPPPAPDPAASRAKPAPATSRAKPDPAPAPVQAPTDPAGRFTLRGLAAGRHRLRVAGRGVLAAEVRFVDVPGAPVRVLVSRRTDVRGRVVDGGRPVGGASVRLLLFGAAAPLSATTDASGAFAFDDLPEGRFRLWAAREARASAAQAVDRVGPGPFAPVDLVMGPAAIVNGRVVDSASGRGVAARVTLVADDPDQPPRAATSSADGGFRVDGVPLGRWTADAFAPGYISADAVRFEAGAGYAPSIALRRGGVLAGRVVDGGGAPVAGATVLARSEGGGADVSAETVAGRLGGGSAGGWDPGLALAAGADTGLVTATGLRFVPRGELGVLVGPLPFPPPAGAASVRVAAPTGGAPGAAAGAPALPVDPALEPRFVTDRDGRFRLTGLAPGRYRVLAAHPEFADGASPPREVELDGAPAEIEVVLYAGLILHGSVVDERGAPVAGAAVEAKSGPSGPDPRYTVTGADGRYRLTPIATDVVLEVGAPGHGSAAREIAVGPLGGAPVLRREDFTLVQADAALEGRVLDANGSAVAGASVRVAGGASRAARPAVTDAAGQFRLAGVVGGSHRLRVEHPDYAPAEVEAATGAAVELRLSFGGAIAVDVRDRSGGAPIAGASVLARGPAGAARRAAAGRDGRVELGRLTPGRWTVEASARGYAAASADVEVAAGDRRDPLSAPAVRVELTRGATLSGVVRDAAGQRVAGASVTAGRAHAASDADGRFRLTDVASGPVTVEAEKDGARGALSLDLSPGQELVTVELRLE